MRRPYDSILVPGSVHRYMVLYHFLGCRMIFQLPVYIVRQTLPALFSENLNQFFICELMVLLAGGQALQHLVQFPRLPLGSGVADFFRFGFVCLLRSLRLRLVEDAFLPETFQPLCLQFKSLGLHRGDLLHEKSVLFLCLQEQRYDLIFIQLIQFFRSVLFHGVAPVSGCLHYTTNTATLPLFPQQQFGIMTVEKSE